MPSRFTAIVRMVMKRAARILALIASVGCWLATGPGRAEEICTFSAPPDISIDKELMITDLSGVKDARASPANGAWSCGGLMTALAPNDAPALVKQWLDSFAQRQQVNGFPL